MKRMSLYFGILLMPLAAFAEGEQDAKGVVEVSPTEDLMREHGILNRLLLIYEEIIDELGSDKEVYIAELKKAAQITRDFVEDYHEKLEEEYIFPVFVKANKMTDLVSTLKSQHQKGRELTTYILSAANENTVKDPAEKKKLKSALEGYVAMFRPHEAREDTELFPSFKTLVSRKDYDTLGDTFEKKEQEKFGKDGFNTVVRNVTNIEKELEINDLSQFTSKKGGS